MSRVILPLVVLMLGLAAAGCGSSGIGDPCSPAHPALTPGQDGGCAPGAGCFQSGEIYIETRSLQCRTRVCMVYHWDEVGLPDEHSQHVFCTCRCGGSGDPATWCTCGDGFQCLTAFNAGEPGIRGSYCVRNEAISGGVTDAGTSN